MAVLEIPDALDSSNIGSKEVEKARITPLRRNCDWYTNLPITRSVLYLHHHANKLNLITNVGNNCATTGLWCESRDLNSGSGVGNAR